MLKARFDDEVRKEQVDVEGDQEDQGRQPCLTGVPHAAAGGDPSTRDPWPPSLPVPSRRAAPRRRWPAGQRTDWRLQHGCGSLTERRSSTGTKRSPGRFRDSSGVENPKWALIGGGVQLRGVWRFQ